MKSKSINILIVGVGGQGTLLASKLMGKIFIDSGYDVKVGEVHKYTVVVWIEGDDPDCTNDLIGERIGFEMHMQMVDEDIEE